MHSKRVEKMCKFTRNEWRRCANALETSGEDVKLHPIFSPLAKLLSVEPLRRPTVGELSRDPWLQGVGGGCQCCSTNVDKVGENYTRFGCGRRKITLVSGVEDAKLHSFRVWKMQNYTRFECGRCIQLKSHSRDSAFSQSTTDQSRMELRPHTAGTNG